MRAWLAILRERYPEFVWVPVEPELGASGTGGVDGAVGDRVGERAAAAGAGAASKTRTLPGVDAATSPAASGE